MKKKKVQHPNYPTKSHRVLPDGPNGMTYIDHLNKSRERQGLEPLTEFQKRHINYRGNISKYDL